jgi:hypothetical protein
MSNISQVMLLKRSALRFSFILILIILLLGVLLPVTQVYAQDELEEQISFSVNAGYDGRLRPNMWSPLRITVTNNGTTTITGKFVVRPETTGRAIPNAFSTPVDLAANTEQLLFLYVVTRGNVSSTNPLRVELLNDAGDVIVAKRVPATVLEPRDNLYIVVTDTPNSTLNLTDLAVGGYQAFQANWSVENIPDHVAALESINMMMFTDVDSGALTPAQKRAITAWVMGGGHLIVTGGANWQPTATSFDNLLPLIPNGSETAEDLTALAHLAGRYSTTLEDNFVLAEGDLIDSAYVLAATDDGTPLVARRQFGNGTVDYIAIDPENTLLRNWDELPQLWMSLLTSTNAQPSWTFGFSNWEPAIAATEILPGLNMFPAIITLTGFMLAYIMFVGPLNYFVLSRFNRREYAWFTIPILIVLFTAMAWSFGTELRGTDVTLSRLSVIQTWPDAEEAKMDQLIGLLAPRRDNYTLSIEDDRFLRPISENVANVGTAGRSLTDVEIVQSNHFAAVDFPVDSSFIASFTTSGTTDKPDISGRVTFTNNSASGGVQAFQGSVSNDSDIELHNPVILARGNALRLDAPLLPGETYTFDSSDLIVAFGDEIPISIPSSLEHALAVDTPFTTTSESGLKTTLNHYVNESMYSIMDIVGSEYYNDNFSISFSDSDEEKEIRRRQALLESFVIDQYASDAQGNRVFLIGWSNDTHPSDEDTGGEHNVIDTTLYIIEVEVEHEMVAATDTFITADQFTWVSLERSGQSNVGPMRLTTYPGTNLIYQFTPLPEAVLSEVDELTVLLNKARSNSSESSIGLWNWQTEEWEQLVLPINQQKLVEISIPNSDMPDITQYLGPQNSVRININDADTGRALIIIRMGIEQRGRY